MIYVRTIRNNVYILQKIQFDIANFNIWRIFVVLFMTTGIMEFLYLYMYTFIYERVNNCIGLTKIELYTWKCILKSSA